MNKRIMGESSGPSGEAGAGSSSSSSSSRKNGGAMDKTFTLQDIDNKIPQDDDDAGDGVADALKRFEKLQ